MVVELEELEYGKSLVGVYWIFELRKKGRRLRNYKIVRGGGPDDDYRKGNEGQSHIHQIPKEICGNHNIMREILT